MADAGIRGPEASLRTLNCTLDPAPVHPQPLSIRLRGGGPRAKGKRVGNRIATSLVSQDTRLGRAVRPSGDTRAVRQNLTGIRQGSRTTLGRARTDTEQPRGVEHAVPELLVEALRRLRRVAQCHATTCVLSGRRTRPVVDGVAGYHAPSQIARSVLQDSRRRSRERWSRFCFEAGCCVGCLEPPAGPARRERQPGAQLRRHGASVGGVYVCPPARPQLVRKVASTHAREAHARQCVWTRL